MISLTCETFQMRAQFGTSIYTPGSYPSGAMTKTTSLSILVSQRVSTLTQRTLRGYVPSQSYPIEPTAVRSGNITPPPPHSIPSHTPRAQAKAVQRGKIPVEKKTVNTLLGFCGQTFRGKKKEQQNTHARMYYIFSEISTLYNTKAARQELSLIHI